MKNVYLKTFGIAAALFLLLTTFAMANTPDANQNDTTANHTQKKQPEFVGGKDALYQFLSDNIKYPEEALKSRRDGRVICRFVIERDGSVSNIEVVESSGNKYLDNEAIRVLSTMPKWIPGEVDGKKARVRANIPIRFQIPLNYLR